MDSVKKYTNMQEWLDELQSKLNWFERNIEIPFYRHIWNPVRDFYYGLIHLPGNIRKWAKFVWTDRDWDYEHTLEAMEIKCRAQAKLLKTYAHAENSEKYGNEALACAEALKRIRLDDYFSDMLGEFNKALPENFHEMYEAKMNEDIQIVKDSFDKIRHWWD